jgi:ectoine hydroxylase-related dioxygenase (phytanoyl-CoA dioxygenase family)
VIEDGAFLEDHRVTVPVMKGEALVMTNRTPHRSIENTSDVIRWSVDLRYQSADLPTNYPPMRSEPPAESEAASG